MTLNIDYHISSKRVSDWDRGLAGRDENILTICLVINLPQSLICPLQANQWFLFLQKGLENTIELLARPDFSWRSVIPPNTHMALSWRTAEWRCRAGGGVSDPPWDTKCQVSLPKKNNKSYIIYEMSWTLIFILNTRGPWTVEFPLSRWLEIFFYVPQIFIAKKIFETTRKNFKALGWL